MGNEIQSVSAACEDATRALRQASSGFIRMQASGFVWRRGLIVTSRLRALAGGGSRSAFAGSRCERPSKT